MTLDARTVPVALPCASVPVAIGCAGWSLPRALWPRFPAEGTHLARYAARLGVVEINSSFYRPHRPDTYRRWAASVPPGFRFSVKCPRAITHDRGLRDAVPLLEAFLEGVQALGQALGPLLVQLPPGLAFAPDVAAAFLRALRQRHTGPVVWEPRHPAWFSAEATQLLACHDVSRVAADPAPVADASRPAGASDLAYYRLHGSPRRYYSAYGPERLRPLAAMLRRQAATGRRLWCIFDNTAEGAALADALLLRELLAPVDAAVAGDPVDGRQE